MSEIKVFCLHCGQAIASLLPSAVIEKQEQEKTIWTKVKAIAVFFLVIALGVARVWTIHHRFGWYRANEKTPQKLSQDRKFNVDEKSVLKNGNVEVAQLRVQEKLSMAVAETSVEKLSANDIALHTALGKVCPFSGEVAAILAVPMTPQMKGEWTAIVLDVTNKNAPDGLALYFFGFGDSSTVKVGDEISGSGYFAGTQEVKDADGTQEIFVLVGRIDPTQIKSLPTVAEQAPVARPQPVEAPPQMEIQPTAFDPNHPEWNIKDLSTDDNGNLITAVKVLLAKPDITQSFTIPQPELVKKAPWNYYGKVLRMTGSVAIADDSPPDSPLAKALGGEASQIVIECYDGTTVEMFCMKSSRSIRVRNTVSLYGLPVGVDQVSNTLGGTDPHVILVGNKYDIGR